MLLDMRPMLRGETKRIELNYRLEPDLPDEAEATKPMLITGLITDQAGYMRLSLSATLPYRAVCARCLEEVTGDFRISLERTVVAEGTLTEEQLEENVDEYAVIQDGKLDVDGLVQEELFLSFPMRFLCSPDCLGLCPKCGKPKRLGDCGCSVKEIDPRLAVLKTLLDRNEEGQ